MRFYLFSRPYKKFGPTQLAYKKNNSFSRPNNENGPTTLNNY